MENYMDVFNSNKHKKLIFSFLLNHWTLFTWKITQFMMHWCKSLCWTVENFILLINGWTFFDEKQDASDTRGKHTCRGSFFYSELPWKLWRMLCLVTPHWAESVCNSRVPKCHQLHNTCIFPPFWPLFCYCYPQKQVRCSLELFTF